MPDLSPWPRGQTAISGLFTLTQAGNLLAINFSPAPTFNILIKNLETGVEITGTSTVSISDAATSKVSCAWSTADVTQPVGFYQLRVLVTYGGGDGPTGLAYSDPLPWQLV